MSDKKQNPLFEDGEMQRYFASLPELIQETIKQSAMEMNSLEELRKCAENLMECPQSKLK